MARILVINPNSSTACSAGIDVAIAPLRFPGGPRLDVVTTPDGPPAVYSWRDWHAAVEPVCRTVARETADVFIVACASDPGIEAVRATTDRPVIGVFRAAVAASVARGERFGIVALVDASKERHMLALRAMGLENRLAAEIALNATMDELLDPVLTRARLIQVGRALAAAGAGTIVLGCTGMAHHRAAIAAAAGVPVVEPCQAAVAQALLAVVG